MKQKIGEYLMKLGQKLFTRGEKLRFKPLPRDIVEKWGSTQCKPEEDEDEYGGYGESMF